MLLIPTLDHYEQFANSFVHLMHNEIEVSMMWGLLHLVLKVSLYSTSNLSRVRVINWICVLVSSRLGRNTGPDQSHGEIYWDEDGVYE